MCIYNTISSHIDHIETQKRDSEESLLTFENRIMARVYVRSITHSTMYQKAPFFLLAGTGV